MSGHQETRWVKLERPWRRISGVLAIAAGRWLAPRTALFAAALAFHALLALAPILLVVLSVAGPLLGQEAARKSLSEAADRFAGPRADRILSAVLDLTAGSHWSAGGTLLGVVLLLYFSSSLFARLRSAFDVVWEVRPKGVGRTLLDRLVSFGETVVAVAALLLVLAVGALRSVVWPYVMSAGAVGEAAWSAWTRLGTLLMTSLVLAAAFRWMPNVRPRPRPGAVLMGALPTALTLNMANHAIGFVISRSALASLYGAAGSLIIILLWTYYSAWIVLFGAEICRAWDEQAPGVYSPRYVPESRSA